MPPNSKPVEKENLHSRNLHRGRYNFKQLSKSNPELKVFLSFNQYQDESIDFSDSQAVKALNKGLLKHFYGIDDWEIPEGYLCPPIPGRADYIHYAADVLADDNNGAIPTGDSVKVLDIGVGANCIYPLIGSSIYGWQFVGTDIDPVAVSSAKGIISLNKKLQDKILIRQQTNGADIFKGVIEPGEVFDLSICNPPFHASKKDAKAATATKWRKLGVDKPSAELLNFGGKNTELWYAGGEANFINRMVEQSALIPDNCLWFTTLVSKKETLPGVYNALKWVKALDVKTVAMSQGQKASRMVAWTFFTPEERLSWGKRWAK